MELYWLTEGDEVGLSDNASPTEDLQTEATLRTGDYNKLMLGPLFLSSWCCCLLMGDPSGVSLIPLQKGRSKASSLIFCEGRAFLLCSVLTLAEMQDTASEQEPFSQADL